MLERSKNIAYFTICARNYLAYAITLRKSLLAQSPESEFYIFLSDSAQDGDSVVDNTITATELKISKFDEMTFRYTVLELATAIKPQCFLHLFEKLDYKSAVYLDPDIFIYAPLDHVERALKEQVSCILTPHLLRPLLDSKQPSNIDILRSGTYNLGFIAFSNCKESVDFLEWWAKQLETHCYSDLQNGLFVDQKFAEYAPSFIENVRILRHPGYNVAYWNLSHRNIEIVGDEVLCEGELLRFFHFSGINPMNGTLFSKHQNRFDIHTIGPVAMLLRRYIEQILLNDHDKWSKVDYAYDRFCDGEKIPAVIRRIQTIDDGETIAFDNPRWDYWHEHSPEVEESPGVRITNLMVAIYRSRPDLQSTFPLSTYRGRKNFFDWFIENAGSECGVPESAIRLMIKSDLWTNKLKREVKKRIKQTLRRAY